MILSDAEIRRSIGSGEIGIVGLIDIELQVQPGSVDLRLGDTVRRYYDDVERVKPAEDDHEEITYEEPIGESLEIGPDDFVLVPTLEKISLPSDILGRVTGRSSYGRAALEVHCTAGLLDPGWSGHIVLELSNNAEFTLELEPGERICQVTFERLSEPAERDYADRADSKYQNQEGAQASMAHIDPD